VRDVRCLGEIAAPCLDPAALRQGEAGQAVAAGAQGAVDGVGHPFGGRVQSAE